jgi:hypothetical protein
VARIDGQATPVNPSGSPGLMKAANARPTKSVGRAGSDRVELNKKQAGNSGAGSAYRAS